MRGLVDRLLGDRRPPRGAHGPLAADERVLGWAVAAEGGAVVVTTLGVWWPEADRPVRLDWHGIHQATWSGEELALVPGEEVEPGVVRDAARRSVRLTEPRNVPAEVRTRVTRSVVHSSHHVLPGGGGVRVVARRVMGEDGVTWLLRFDSEADRADPASRAAAEEFLDEVRRRNDG